MDELSLVIAEQPLADDVSIDVGEEVIGEDDLPVVGDDGAPTDDGFVWDGGTFDDVTIDDGTVDDAGIIGDGSSGEDDLIGDDGSWSCVELHASEDDAAWDGGVATDPIIWFSVDPDESSLGYQQLGRPMFEDKGPADGTEPSTDGLIDPATCGCFAYDAIV